MDERCPKCGRRRADTAGMCWGCPDETVLPEARIELRSDTAEAVTVEAAALRVFEACGGLPPINQDADTHKLFDAAVRQLMLFLTPVGEGAEQAEAGKASEARAR